MAPYRYTPLPLGDEPVDGTAAGALPPERELYSRILTIHQGEYDDDLEVDLEVVALENERASDREYDALSYVWGSEEKPHTVLVGEDKQTIRITRNLDKAIRHLRYKDRARRMWIDALCIDQENPEERSRQVSYMSRTFWTAPRVVVWLGPSADDSDHALDILQHIGSRVQIEWSSVQVTGVTEHDEEQWGDHRDYLPLSDRQHKAILALVCRPWFERIWIRQEVFRANDKSLLLCGAKAVGWREFQRGLFCYIKHPLPHTFSRKQPLETKRGLIATILHESSYSLQYLRHDTTGSLCTDPRDYIYALLGMMYGEHKRIGIVPDYSKPVSEVYQDVALQYFTTIRDLDLLRGCGRNYLNNPDAPKSDPSISIPTWVPNWSVPEKMLQPLYIWRDICPFYASAKYLGDGVLRAAGVLAGEIQDFIHLDAATPKALATSIRAVVPYDAIDTPYPGGGNLWDAFRITLCANFFCDRTDPPNLEEFSTSIYSLSSQGSKEAMRSIMAEEAMEELYVPNFLALVRMWSDNGRFFITQEGHLGWGPKMAEKGDRIVSFLGCDLPILIRRSTVSDRRCFEVLGPCYLHGFMYGEAFLGPLPDGVRPVLHIRPSTQLKFHNSTTGSISAEDPRLSTFPVNLERYRRKVEEGYRVRFNIGREIWKSRNVEVVDFDLV